MKLVVKSKTLCINNKNRLSGSDHDEELHIPEKYVACLPHQHLRITVMSFSTYEDWYTINLSNNVVQVFDHGINRFTTLSLPFGNYTYRNLARSLNSLYEKWTWVHNQEINKFEITTQTNHTLIFEDGRVFGFNKDGNNPFGMSFVSPNVLKPNLLDHICLHIKKFTPYE